MWSGTASIDDRVRNSELFPRIRDAEAIMHDSVSKLKANYDEYILEKQAKMAFDAGSLDGSNSSAHSGSISKKSKKGSVNSVNSIDKKKKTKNVKKDKEKKKDKEPEPIEKEEYFSTFELAKKDPEYTKYLDYTELQYPKLFGQSMEFPPDSIHTLWMSGFLDRAQRDGEMLMKQKYKKMLEVKENKPKSTLFDTNHYEKKKIVKSKKDISANDIEAPTDDDDIHEFVRKMFSDQDRGIERGYDDLSSVMDRKKTLNDIEMLKKADDVSSIESIKNADELVSVNGSIETSKSKKSIKQNKTQTSKIFQVMKPYLTEIKAEKLRMSRTKKPEVVDFVSTELEDYFEHLRREHIAASKIQDIWRRSHILEPWKLAIKGMLAAAKIQRVARGMITRKWVARWFYTRNTTVTDVQAQIRKVLSNKKLRPIQAKEWRAAIIIQKYVRRRQAKHRYKEILGHVCAIRIQIMWRGIVARTKADKMWLERVVIPIQRHGRSIISRKTIKIMKKDYYLCASIIQRAWRRFDAIRKMSERLHQRDMAYVNDTINILASEEEYAQAKLERMTDRMLKNDFRKKAHETLDELHKSYDDIRQKENSYIEMMRQRETLSPRALQQGWIQELDKQVFNLRNEITDMKFKCLFHDAMAVYNVDHHLEEKIREIEDMSLIRNKAAESRERELDIRREKESWKEIIDKRKQKRQAIGDEKRKWAIRFYTSDGKPDKKRRPGKRWDKEVYAGPDKAIYSSTNVDLFAFDKNNGVTKLGSKESLDGVLESMTLQTYLEQMNHYENLLNPVYKIFQGTVGAPPGKRAPEQLGWGPIGDTLAPALWNIDAVPENWKRPLTPRGTHIAKIKREVMKVKAITKESIEEKRREIFEKTGQLLDDDVIQKRILSDLRRVAQQSGVGALSMQAEGMLKEEVASLRRDHQAKRKLRAETRLRSKAPTSIPWKLLDALDAEKRKFEIEKITNDIGRNEEKKMLNMYV